MKLKTLFTGLMYTFFVFSAALLISCSDMPPDDTGGTTAGPAVATLTLLSSSPQLDSAGTGSVTLTVLARDANNNLLRDVIVTFSSDTGSVQVTQGTTDEDGMASAVLTTAGDPTNRDITVTATNGTITAQTVVNVRGTIVDIDGFSSIALNQQVDLTVTLLDSSGTTGIAGEVISVSSALGNAIVDKNNGGFVTDQNGKVTITVTASIAGSGTDTITASALNATGSHTMTISTQDVFTFTSPTSSQEINLGTCQLARIHWTNVLGTATVGSPVNFSTTRGQLYTDPSCSSILGANNNINTDGSGNSTVYIRSTSSGPTGIYAVGNPTIPGPSAQISVEFVATTAATLDLQANPAVIGVNTAGSTSKQSQLNAIIRDANNNPVKNKVIDFTITSDTSGGSLSGSPATTNSFGSVSSIYTAGNVTGSVTIQAVVQETPAVNDTVTITVAQQALFVTAGTSNTITDNGLSYSMPWEVRVTDAAGGPVAGAKVNLSLVSDAYYKGYWEWNDTDSVWDQTTTAGPCANEDLDRDGNLDAGEDTNNNGTIEPGGVAAVVPDTAFADPTSPSSVITNTAGVASFTIQYSQNYANWVNVTLTVRTGTAGSEWQDSVSFNLPILATDVTTETIPPPGVFSPFGQANVCTNPN